MSLLLQKYLQCINDYIDENIFSHISYASNVFFGLDRLDQHLQSDAKNRESKQSNSNQAFYIVLTFEPKKTDCHTDG